MDAVVVVELGMEREADLLAVANGHDASVVARHDFDVISGFGDVRCPDEREGTSLMSSKSPRAWKLAR